jgi:hypothetical protein
VPWTHDAEKWLDRLRFAGPSRDLLRNLQPYGVAVYKSSFLALGQGALVDLGQGFYALPMAPGPNYDRDCGFLTEADAGLPLMA